MTHRSVHKQILFSTMSAIVFLIPSLGNAGGTHGHHSPASDMAQMVMTLNHHPSDADKTRLNEILADDKASTQEKAIASALIGMDHSVSDSDKAKLKAIAEDAAAPANVRDLASVLMNLKHMASADEKAKLKMVAQ